MGRMFLAGKASAQALGFIDMGAMLCQPSPDEASQCHGLTQLLIPGLELRAWKLPALKGVQASPGEQEVGMQLMCPVLSHVVGTLHWGQGGCAGLGWVACVPVHECNGMHECVHVHECQCLCTPAN